MTSFPLTTLPDDDELIAQATHGNRQALEALIKRHQDFIYNVALRMFLHPDDALDASQEVLIKVITRLKTFKRKSSFRTWLYRIVVNHFLTTRARKTELIFQRDMNAFGGLAQPDADDSVSEAEVEETRLMCSTAFLMCLSRDQRLVYVLGEIFGADHQLGAALFQISPGNFRLKLHRARTDLLNFVHGKCGLINPKNPCRCPKKAQAMVKAGLVNRDKLLFHDKAVLQIKSVVQEKQHEVENKLHHELRDLFQESPYQTADRVTKLLDDLIK